MKTSIESKERYTIKRIHEDVNLRLRQEKLVETWCRMTDKKLQEIYNRKFKAEYHFAIEKRKPFSFPLRVFLLHQAFRVTL